MSVSSQQGRQKFGVTEQEYGNVQSSFQEKNEACIVGIIEENFQYSHMCHEQNFYKTRVIVKRLSGTVDFVPIVVSETLKKQFFDGSEKGKFVQVTGRFSSYNARGEDGKKHLYLFLFALGISVYESEEYLDAEEEVNCIHLKGYICKPPVFRKTPLGREITDLILAVRRASNTGRADYIPCIAWGSNAKYTNQLKVGDLLSLQGRIQSREYLRRYYPDSEEGEYKTAYEVSIMWLED